MRIESWTTLIVHFAPAILLGLLTLSLTANHYQRKMDLAAAACRQEIEQGRSELESARRQADALASAHQSLQQAHLVQQKQLRQVQVHVGILEEQLRQAQRYSHTLEERLRAASPLPEAGQTVSVGALTAATVLPAGVPGQRLTGPQQSAIAAIGSVLLILCILAASGFVRGPTGKRSILKPAETAAARTPWRRWWRRLSGR